MKKVLELTLTVGSSLVLSDMLFGNFSRHTRELIWQRAKGLSELSKRSDRPRECAHLDHNKARTTYDSPDTGLLVTDLEHLAHHLLFKDHPQEIGLTRQANHSAIGSLVHRVRAYNKRIGLDEDSYAQELQEAADMWATQVYPECFEEA